MHSIWTMQNGYYFGKCFTKAEVIRKYNKFREKADVVFLPYFKSTLKTEHEFIQHLDFLVGNYHLRRSSKQKSSLNIEHESGYIYLNYTTTKNKTIIDLYLFFDRENGLLHKVVFEVAIPDKRSGTIRNHTTICRKMGFTRVNDENTI
jgi:hypothetical protein